MKTNIFYVSEEALIEAIRRLYPNKIKSKDYEYLISIYVKRIFERHDNKTYKITFELNSKQQEPNGFLELTSDEIIKILRTYLKENTDVDFGLAPVKESGVFEKYAYPFQVKRFIGFSKDNFLLELVKFIEEKSRHYVSPETTLVVMPQFSFTKDDVLNARIVGFSEYFFRDVANKISINGKPLRSVLIFSIKEIEPALTQVWPNYGEYK
jgi:hypothetical protein